MQSKWLLLCAAPLLLPAGLDRLPGGAGEAVRMGLLAEPATALASLFCSGPLARDTLTGWPLLPGWAGTVRVTPDCAGLQFWGIALAVALFHVLPGRVGLARLRAAAAGVLASYALTLLLNASRILVVGVCLPLAQSWPDVLAGALHLGIGVLVFLPGLVGFSVLLTRFRTLEVERPRETGGISGRGVSESREDPRPPKRFPGLGPEAPAESPISLHELPQGRIPHFPEPVILSVPAKDLFCAGRPKEIPHPCAQGIRDDTIPPTASPHLLPEPSP